MGEKKSNVKYAAWPASRDEEAELPGLHSFTLELDVRAIDFGSQP